jgi:hypothetical protein
LVTAALLVFCDCELVCALATERPSPDTAMIANGISSRVEDLPIRFRSIIISAFHPKKKGDRHNGRSPQEPA